MTTPKPPSPPGRRRRSGARAGADLWRTPAPLPEVEPIVVPHDVLGLIRSLGDAPMIGSMSAGDYLEKVIERTASVGAALAFSAGLLAEADGDEPDADVGEPA